MKILIVSPSLEPYGGVRVILNWAKYLSWNGNEVTLCSVNGEMHTPWFTIPEEIKLKYSWPRQNLFDAADIVIATNPDTVMYCYGKARKMVYLCQMAEELFFEAGSPAAEKATNAAFLPIPMITVADWVKYKYHTRTAPVYVVPNGTDREFLVSIPRQQVDKPVFIVEGWNSNNEAKDVSGLVRMAVKKLKETLGQRVSIIGYGQTPLNPNTAHWAYFDEYVVSPSTSELAEMYARANYLLKASRYETRSLAPLEAMACECIPIVAITQGHPDLIHRYNSFVAPYESGIYGIEETLFWKSIQAALILTAKEKANMKDAGKRTIREWQDVVNYMANPILIDIENG